ncbi:MAG: DUF4203 domain-containing protein [Acidobacteria bacterium]|nr:DUF4203 domain-containing protein [Acidobacteriota bacterium]
MLPAAYQVPAAILLVIGGLVACFAGYRVFRTVLGIYGFIFGAFVATSAMGTSDTAWLVGAALVGGIVGALLLLAAYFIGVALVGAGAGALIANLIWTWIEGDPHPFIIVLFSVAGALLATWLQRYVITLVTAFGGAWTMLVGALALMGIRGPLDATTAGNIWVAYPLNPAPGVTWLPWAWVVLGLLGTAVQMAIVGGGDGTRPVRFKRRRPARE